MQHYTSDWGNKPEEEREKCELADNEMQVSKEVEIITAASVPSRK